MQFWKNLIADELQIIGPIQGSSTNDDEQQFRQQDQQRSAPSSSTALHSFRFHKS